MRQTIERITEIATQCLTLGVYVYSETRESLLASKDFPFEESQWEYKFDLKQEAFYGPYSHSQMLQWVTFLRKIALYIFDAQAQKNPLLSTRKANFFSVQLNRFVSLLKWNEVCSTPVNLKHCL